MNSAEHTKLVLQKPVKFAMSSTGVVTMTGLVETVVERRLHDPADARKGWTYVQVGTREFAVTCAIDAESIAIVLGYRAIRNKSRKSVGMSGQIKCSAQYTGPVMPLKEIAS